MRLGRPAFLRPRPAPVGRRGVFEVTATFGRSSMFGRGAIETRIQVEVVELERRGQLSHVWYDKKTMTGHPPSAYPSTICSMLPAWQHVGNVVWFEEDETSAPPEALSVDASSSGTPHPRSRISPLAD